MRYPIQPEFQNTNWKRCWPRLAKTDWRNKPQLLDYLAYQRGYYDRAFFASYFFAHHCRAPFSAMHLDFCRDAQEPQQRGKREAIAAPRGNAKTTFKLLIQAIHSIVYGLESFILVFAHSYPEAKEKIRSILEELETNTRLIRVYGPLAPVRGKPETGRWGTGTFITQNGIMVMGKSRGQQIRGVKQGANRPSSIICDDVESPEGVLSPEQRLKTHNWFFKDVLKCGQIDGSTNITVIGTCLHPESLLSELLQSPGFHSKRYQSVIAYATNQSLWEQWQRLYTDLSNPNRHTEAHTFFAANREALLEGVEVLWSEGEPYEALMRIRVDEGIASFQSEKQNDPFDPDRQIFVMAQARRFQVIQHEGKEFSLRWLDGSKRKVHYSQLTRIVAFHDPALGKKPGQVSEPDYAAIVVVAKDADGYLYCLDAYIEKDTPSRQIQKAFQLAEKWGVQTLYLEENNFQSLLKEHYAEENRKRGSVLRVKGVQQSENKYKRISTLEPEISNGYLLFADTVNPRLIEQLSLFPTSYDDGPDALQGAVSQLKKRFDGIRNAPR
jgi:predicted phage terminase large subunit-like protein